EDVKRMASFLARSRIAATRVVHSGKLRALETALLLAEVLGPGNVVEENADQLAPNDPVEPVIDTINGWTDDTIIVGHLPFMSKLTSKLVTGDEFETVVHFKPGSVACLERGENGDGWTVQWFIRPELLGG
ncbi:MAG: phosphohistidine phosphatase SixA, partial [Alphaproteobacteria bacterium]|nr:phosphohistidine phosphatase SixA [Alphaproteobacteria bacterium]